MKSALIESRVTRVKKEMPGEARRSVKARRYRMSSCMNQTAVWSLCVIHRPLSPPATAALCLLSGRHLVVFCIFVARA